MHGWIRAVPGRNSTLLCENTMKKLYIGNISFQTTDSGLRRAFEQYSSVTSVKIISDKFSGESRGFGFVEFSDDAEGDRAIQEMNGFELDGKSLKVNEARPQTESRGGGFGGGFGSRPRSSFGSSGRGGDGRRSGSSRGY